MLNFLNLLAETASTNDKLAILESAKNDTNKRLVFELAYNPRIKFWIKKRPESSYFSTVYHKGDLTKALNELVENIANRKLTGNAAIKFVSNLLNNLTKFDQEVLYRVIERDLKCGVNVKLINKVWKDLIPEYPVLPKKLKKILNIQLFSNAKWILLESTLSSMVNLFQQQLVMVAFYLSLVLTI
jgi:hypothetical protein